jgi:(R)-2-hydroxyacyl-CoA dehydratese activating ATPase
MNTLGIDVGSLNIKAVILGDGKVLASRVALCGEQIEPSAREVVDRVLSETGLSLESLPAVSTGIGAKAVSFIPQQKVITTCLARGINNFYPTVKMVIDMGAESTTVVKLNNRGKLTDWANHDKCASGTGLFLQQMAKLMALPIDKMAVLSTGAISRADITSTCAVFAESEVISHVHRDPPTPMADIAAGIYFSVVSRVVSLCKRVGIEKDVAVTGGVALNSGLIGILEKELGFQVIKPDSPQAIAALGAAIIALENAEKGIK